MIIENGRREKNGGHRFGRKVEFKERIRKSCKDISGRWIYKTSVQAVDKAKQKSEHFLQFMIDTKNPVIKMVDELQGKYLKKFSWDYPVDVFIKDFTTFVHSDPDGRKVISDWDRD